MLAFNPTMTYHSAVGWGEFENFVEVTRDMEPYQSNRCEAWCCRALPGPAVAIINHSETDIGLYI